MIGNVKACEQIAHYYGIDSQLEMLVEECSELITAVQKVKRETSTDAFANFIQFSAEYPHF